jgi:RNA polymerase sigma factor (sigma-70 family)
MVDVNAASLVNPRPARCEKPPTVNASDTRPQMARIASGDSEAFTLFYRKWFGPMCGEVRRLTGRDESFCLDVVQDAMMKVVRSTPVFADEPSLRAWLSMVVMRCAYDQLRGEKRRSARERGDVARSREPSLERDELLRRLSEEMGKLDPDRFALLRLRHGMDWTLERIGAMVGLKAGAVDGRIGRTLASLREKLKESGHDRIL